MYNTTTHNYKMLGPQLDIQPNKISIPYLLEKAPRRLLNISTFSWDAYSRVGCRSFLPSRAALFLVHTVGQTSLKGLKLVLRIARMFTWFNIQS